MPGLVFRQRIGGLPCISGAENRLPNREAVPPKQLTTTRPLLRSCPVAACRKLSPSHGLRRAQAISNRRWKAALGLQDVRLFKTIENRERYRPPWQLRRIWLPKATAVYVIDISIRLSATDRIRPKTTGCQVRLPVPQDLKIFTKN